MTHIINELIQNTFPVIYTLLFKYLHGDYIAITVTNI